MINASKLSKKYGNNTVLNIEHLNIPKGQSFGLVGNNGAGKTTFFSLLLDLIKPSSGHITSKDILVNNSEDWKPFTSAFIDESFLIGYLTPEEYFYFRSEEHTSELQSRENLVCRLLLEKKKNKKYS